MNQLQKLQQWLLYTPLGRYVLRNERAFYSNAVKNIYGTRSLQIGLEQINLLQGNKINNHINIPQATKCNLQFLPFANQSIDLIVCPHILEFNTNHQHIIDEFYRVLSNNGTLIITSFNQQYWARRFCSRDIFNEVTQFVNLNELKELLVDTGFAIRGGKFFSYCPPINKSKAIYKLKWLDKAGDRWFPTTSMNFGLVVTKDTLGLTREYNHQNQSNEELNTEISTAKICKMK